MINLLIFTILFASVAFIAYHAVIRYRATEGTFWERLLSGFKDSATLFVAGATYVGGALIQLIGQAADALNQPEIAEMVRTQIPPEYTGYGMMAFALIVVIARLRSL